MRALAVIPVFDEAATVGAVVAAARRHVAVLVVDDGSRDGSAEAAAAAGAEVVRHPRRLGKAQALRTGIAAARRRGASAIVTLDGDGQHDPSELPALLAAATDGRVIVVGNRLADPRALPAGRLNAIRIAGFFVNWAGGLRVEDTQSGFRVYPLALFDEVHGRRGHFVFETEVLLAAAARGWRVREVPVRALARARARSRFRPLPDGLAIGGFLATRVLARCGVEARAAAAAAGAIFHPDRLRARHAAMLDAAAPWGDSPGTWGWAVGLVATRRLVARLDHWWRHPRRRRATAAAVGIAAAPLALPCVLLQAVAGNRLPDLLSPLVTRVYGQDRLETPPLLPPPGVAVHDVLGAREVSSR